MVDGINSKLISRCYLCKTFFRPVTGETLLALSSFTVLHKSSRLLLMSPIPFRFFRLSLKNAKSDVTSPCCGPPSFVTPNLSSLCAKLSLKALLMSLNMASTCAPGKTRDTDSWSFVICYRTAHGLRRHWSFDLPLRENTFEELFHQVYNFAEQFLTMIVVILQNLIKL